MNPIYFSVIIPLYNKDKYIKRTLDSVLKQTFTNFEIIIVDDGSTDNSCEIVESISDPRIRWIRQENGGPSKARNRGIKEAKGQFIAFLDADDQWLPEKLEKQYGLHSKNPEVVWSCSGYKVVGGIREQTVSYSEEGILADAIDAIVDGLTIWTSTVVIRKDVFQNERLYFNEDIHRSEDIEVWYKLACLYPKIGYIKEQPAIYNIKLDGSLTNTAMGKEDFPFLTLRSRLDKELAATEETRRSKLIKNINQISKNSIFRVWGTTKNFKVYNELFKPVIDDKLLIVLYYTSFLPNIIKKIIWKVGH